MLEIFGDILLIHHCFFEYPFSKDKFEHALVKAAKLCGKKAVLAPPTNPGHDLTINGERFSLKTQAGKSLKADKIHISKFMELGKGEWGDRLEDLETLREQFLAHLDSYDRIR